MFLNMKSASLQLISFVNYLNWNDNNPLNAAAAFANPKQFAADFAMIFNSDKLKQRRLGTKISVSEAELSSIAEGSGSNYKNLFNSLIKLGFKPTQIADSVAIAFGGASMYRNRVNSNLKQGMALKEAEKAAFEDFSAITEETQQSSDPSEYRNNNQDH